MDKTPFSLYDFFGYLASGFLLLCAIDYSFDGGWLLKEKIWTVHAIFWTALAYVIGHIVANISSFLLEHVFVRKVLTSPEITLFNEEKPDTRWTKIFPIFYKPFPSETRKRVLDKAKIEGIESPGRGLFFHCHPLVLREKQVSERLTSFLNLYGFCRNISMSALLATPLLLIGFWVNKCAEESKLWWALGALLISVGMFYRYLKFFRHYTQEVFRAYAELPNNKEQL